MIRVNCRERVCAFFLFCTAMASSSPAQTFTTLASLDGSNGSNPDGSLVQRTDGNIYGTTNEGTFRNSGSVFKITPGGTLTLVHYFCSRVGCTDGASPQAGLVLGTIGNYYGTTNLRGSGGDGTVFEITAAGTVFTLHSFDGTDGGDPYAGVVQGRDGNIYGTTVDFGPNGFGTVFRMTPSGTVTTLHSFVGTDGSAPFGGLVQASNGNFYGTTTDGGDDVDCAGGCGTIFEITPGGTFTTLHMFNNADGMNPYDALVQASDGNLYGTTFLGGGGSGCIIDGCGTVFKITPDGTFTNLHSFDGTDGANPYASLIQATDGNLYGTTSGNSAGTGAIFGSIFEITTGGTLTNLHTFGGADGEYPAAALLQATDGNLYGTASDGGANSCGAFGCGTVFKLSTGLGRFVALVPTARAVGRAVRILGNHLTGSTRVTFNGRAAKFTVKSATQIIAYVPTGATTGTVQVVTPSGTLSSNVAFQVLP